MKTVSIQWVKDNLNNINLIDVRPKEIFQNSFSFPIAKNIPLANLIIEPENYLDKSKTYHIICGGGSSSLYAIAELNKLNKYKLINCDGGYASLLLK